MLPSHTQWAQHKQRNKRFENQTARKREREREQYNKIHYTGKVKTKYEKKYKSKEYETKQKK